MNTSSTTTRPLGACTLKRREPRWGLPFAPGLEFNARAVRARAGLVNILIGSALTIPLVGPGMWIVTAILALVFVDMVVAVLLGRTPFSPLGVVATLLVRSFEPQGTPHLPKRFAWSMGPDWPRAPSSCTCCRSQAPGWRASSACSWSSPGWRRRSASAPVAGSTPGSSATGSAGPPDAHS